MTSSTWTYTLLPARTSSTLAHGDDVLNVSPSVLIDRDDYGEGPVSANIPSEISLGEGPDTLNIVEDLHFNSWTTRPSEGDWAQ